MAGLTILNDIILPESAIVSGIRGRLERMNQRTQTQGGFVNVNMGWTRSLRRFELGIVPRTLAQWMALEGLYEETAGGACGFLMRDPKDHRVAAGEGLLQPYTTANVGTAGFGYGVPVYRLAKRYPVLGSSRTTDRRIARPLSTAAVTRGGVAVTSGASAGNMALDADTGEVTFVADSTQALSSVTVGASTVLNFADGTGMVAALSVGERVYLSGISGTAADTLNGLSHAITAKGATSLTISTATTGLAGTGGTAAAYPQASEALAWTGDFYVPVHFESDYIDWQLVRAGPADTRLVSGPSVVLVEVRE